MDEKITKFAKEIISLGPRVQVMPNAPVSLKTALV